MARVRRSKVWYTFKHMKAFKKRSSKRSLKIPKGNQNPYIEEEQTTQWPKEKVQNKSEDPKGVIRIRKSKMNRQHNGQKKK